MIFRRAVILIAVSVSGPAFAARSDWAPADDAQMRLLLTPGANGRIDGGVELVLEPGWYTYWRNPGEAGVPPIFDFSRSDNVANVEVRYPAPVRKDEDGAVSLVYQDEVVFPLSITPRKPDAPITLRADVKFGVCSEICVPTSSMAEVMLSPGADEDALSTARLRGYEERVPKPPEPGRFDLETVSTDGDALTIGVRMPDSSYSDLFAEPPEGWFIGQPEFVDRTNGVSRYRLSLAGRPRDAQIRGQEFRFVAVAGGEAIEKAVSIP
jgi:DsbC/DsbD-like thiol-disulfide interchange protein